VWWQLTPDEHALDEHFKRLASQYILEKIQHVLPRLAKDPSIFPDVNEARRMFVTLQMNNVVKAIDAHREEKKRNQLITENWNL